MTATCVITRPASGGVAPAFDEVTGRSIHPPAATVYDDGPCRIQRSSDPTGMSVTAARTVSAPEYIVSIPARAGLVQVNDLVTVTGCGGDPALVGLRLTVTGSRRGSLTWQRDLVCQIQPPPTTR